MHYAVIVILPADWDTGTLDKIMAPFEHKYWDGYGVGGRWDNFFGRGKTEIPLNKLTTKHIKDAYAVLFEDGDGAQWFAREEFIYTPDYPWKGYTGGIAKHIKRKLPPARWLIKHLSDDITDMVAVIVDVHN